ncbi:MAG: iron-sulfur cluster carrier protein ApbC [Xanthomonadales bacterium]|jgi:ATP-binding protein involved in chromosome partitioning|nr:iron-sulfur cluster carrier protein ApbC [Xanthomonadales bacterium]MDH3925429.1 iron-sulfur cluster carrier protein ApbC [Xanthomonadales bacterium]MDH3940106.1 iron-sulfur cluster carrier protein ApbC [Xanthomonadales bacterium]MDH4002929.1 iron-sulfur cluster carrier protein ApbC [Xanthomonadales bacterium]
MTRLSEQYVKDLLAGINDPNSDTDLISLGWLRGIGLDGQRISVDLRAGYPIDGIRESLVAEIASRLESDPEIEKATISLDWKVVPHVVQGELKPQDQIKNIIAVASGKGGVGKSATAVNLALALRADGARVGVLDADIYGPSMPRMLGVSGNPQTEGNRIIPQRAHGLQVMSIGFMVEEDTPMIWRGPMVTSALQQLLTETNWQGLDYLVVDLPPGTGDIQLTLAQKVPVAGSVIVTTPQDIALLDARKAVQMFRKVNMSVLGIVENMSTHICSQCGHEESIFGSGGGNRMALEYEVPLLGQLPLAMKIRSDLDQGMPTVVSDPDSELTLRYREIARKTAARLATTPRNLALNMPQINILNT